MFTLALFLLAAKHFVADLYLQAVYIKPSLKYVYFDHKSHWHYLHHAGLTAVIFLICVGWPWAVLCFVVDYVTHWHLDWGKTRIARHLACTEQSNPKCYWMLQTVDQILHFVVYFGMVLWVMHSQ
jgi:putative flippase GtrA